MKNPIMVEVDELYGALLEFSSLLIVLEQEWKSEKAWSSYDEEVMNTLRKWIARCANAQKTPEIEKAILELIMTGRECGTRVFLSD